MTENDEREFADVFLNENRDLFDMISERSAAFAEAGRADKIYLLTKATMTILKMANERTLEVLKQTAASQWN